MGSLLYGAGFAMGRLLLQTQQTAIKRELETLAGTLHDSLKPALPQQARPSASLAVVLPGLCLAGEPCSPPADLIHRHAISATDPDRFKLRVLDQHGGLIARSPGPIPQGPKPGKLGWSLSGDRSTGRWATYAIHLHHAHGPGEPTWGYLQISRSLADLDAEAERLWWLGHGVFLLAMLAMAAASWWLAGLAMAPLLEAYRRQEQFSSDVAHELRTPLANLLAVVEAERGAAEQVNPSATASLSRVLVQGQRLQRLIADLLLLASLDQPTRPESQEPCRIAECLEDLIEDFSETAHARGVTLQLQVSAANEVVSGRESELVRLLANLLSNAIQHSPAGGVVRVELDRQGSELCVAVSDQGPGIAEGEQERIFERFYRSDSSRSRQSGGTGLGLAIAQAIARNHRGRLSVQSVAGKGSTFLFQIPVLA
jgi:two-component Ni(II)/redox sensor kinase NrsS